VSLLDKYPQAESSLAQVGGTEIENSITARLTRAKVHHERELRKVNAALDALSNQPEVAELLETVMKAL
jgi:hypothetical protein